MPSSQPPQTLAGRVALVTGAGGGIGRSAALLFARHGARVAAADIDGDAAEAVAREIRKAGGEARGIRADVADSAQARAMVDAAVAAWGRLDCAYNNAGIASPAHPVAEMPDELWRRSIDVMLSGVFFCMKHEIPRILASGGGAIVNCASGAGLIGFPGQSGYVAAKHGVIGLTKAAALEYGAKGIRINAICPGTARTAMVEQVIRERPELDAELVRLHPIGRIAEPAEIAEAALWLCSEGASFVNGAALAVDGGYVAQ